MQPDKVKKISQRFPELNPGWLLTGEGDMLRTTYVQNVNGDGTTTQTGDIHQGDSSALMVALNEMAELRKLLAKCMHDQQTNTAEFLSLTKRFTDLLEDSARKP